MPAHKVIAADVVEEMVERKKKRKRDTDETSVMQIEVENEPKSDKKEKKEKKEKKVKKEKKEKQEKQEKKEKKEKKERKNKPEEAIADDGVGADEPGNDLHEGKPKKRKVKATEDGGEEVSPLPNLDPLARFRISEATRKCLQARGVTKLFPIQEATFDHIYDGFDIIARARTGTGKTLGFGLPMIERFTANGIFANPAMRRLPKILVLAPTRELAQQVARELQSLSTVLKVECVYGGSPYPPQERALRDGVDIIVGTPGRVIDHLDRRTLKLNGLKGVILDEADQMLNVGFTEAVESIFQHIGHAIPDSKDRKELQTLLFSATIPPWVKDVATKYLKPNKLTVDLIEKDKGLKTASLIRHLAISCPSFQRAHALGDVVTCYAGAHGRTIIFAQTKREANELAMNSSIKQECQALHGDIPQTQREVTLAGFREGRFRVLIATDVAARGLDIPEVDLVIQCQPPKEVETYIHRSGRTGRAGREGTCILFFTQRDQSMVSYIEKRTGVAFTRIGAPQPEDIVRASARDAFKSLEGVHSSLLDYFTETAQELINQKGAVPALAAALAYISGHTKPLTTRSLLSSFEGFTTYVLRSSFPIRTNSFVWTALKRYVPEDVVNSVKGLKLFRDGMGAAFDMPAAHTEQMAQVIQEHPTSGLEVAKTLPELVEADSRSASGGHSYSGGDRRGAPSSFGSYGSSRTNGSASRKFTNNDAAKVFVGGLTSDTTDAELGQHFAGCGSVSHIRVVTDPTTGESKGVAFVQFDNEAAANKACRLNGSKLNGRSLRVNMANSKPSGRM